MVLIQVFSLNVLRGHEETWEGPSNNAAKSCTPHLCEGCDCGPGEGATNVEVIFDLSVV